MTGTSEHVIWLGIKFRCYNPKSANFALYGGRGITMCNEWRESFEAFFADMGPRPSKRHSIDRIDNGGSYSPQNCRWATQKQQRINQRGFVLHDFNGGKVTATDAAIACGIKPDTVHTRMRRGMTLQQALNTPVRKV
jgi:hypothetical protein